MINMSHPLVLVFAIPWAVFSIFLLRRQLTSLRWLTQRINPRFIADLTRSTGRSLTAQVVLLFTAGLLLIVAAAGPWTTGEADAEPGTDRSAVILLIDASLSMGADDAGEHPEDGRPFSSRFELAQTLALELVEALPEADIALVSFSGAAVVHSPPTSDHHALRTVLNTMRRHYYSTSMGSRFSSAFDAVIRLTAQGKIASDVILLSDGEISAPDDYEDGLEILADRGIPVHTVAVGSREWQGMNVFVLSDVVAGVDEPRIASEFRTRREDKALRAMSRKTGGGVFVVEHGDWASDILPRLRADVSVAGIAHARQRKDLSRYPIAAFVLLFLIETLILAPRSRRTAVRTTSPWSRHAGSIVALLFACGFTTGCDVPAARAHRLNEKGIRHQNRNEHARAAPLFERSAGFHFREHIPIFNLGNSALTTGDVSSAHDAFERSIRLAPRFAEAYFNDGHTLHQWGQREIDPSGCTLDRTRDLWQQAIRRFEQAAEHAGHRSRLGAAALDNAAFIRAALEELERLAAECPESPSDSSSPPPDGQGESSGETGREDHQPPTADLTAEEQETIARELERIRSASEGAATFRQSQHMQLDPETAAEATGKKIWW